MLDHLEKCWIDYGFASVFLFTLSVCVQLWGEAIRNDNYVFVFVISLFTATVVWLLVDVLANIAVDIDKRLKE